MNRLPKRAGGHITFGEAPALKKQDYDGEEYRRRKQRSMMSGRCLKDTAEVAKECIAFGRFIRYMSSS